MYKPLSASAGGITIAPSAAIPAGKKFTMRDTIFINAQTYERFKSLDAQATMRVLAALTEMGKSRDIDNENEKSIPTDA